MTEEPKRSPLTALWAVLFDDGPPPTRAMLDAWLRDHGHGCEPGYALSAAWSHETTPGLLDLFVWRLRDLPRGHIGASLKDCHEHEIGDWPFGSCLPCADKIRAQLEPPTWAEVVAYVEKQKQAKEQKTVDIKIQHTKSVAIPSLSGGGAELGLKVEFADAKTVVTFTAKKPGSGDQRDSYPAQSVDVGVSTNGIRALITLLTEALKDRAGHEPGDQ